MAEVSLNQLVDDLIRARDATPPDRACLAGISGIDASGKGYIAGKLAAKLGSIGYRIASINVDGWLNLPHIRFLSAAETLPESVVNLQTTAEGKHFYANALRLDEMFSRLILPFKQHRSIHLVMEFADETATKFRPHTYAFPDVDFVLVEGIFIFKRDYERNFDLKIWIDCSFESALRRSVARGQENLGPGQTVAAYRRIYFPAQLTHFEVDDPRAASDLIYNND